jgi:hypothetical protein
MAKKPPQQVRVDQPAPCGSATRSTDLETTEALVPKPATEAPSTPDQLQLHRLIVDTAGRVFRAVSRWLEHKQKHMRVLGWITWLFLLGMLACVLFVLLFRWHPLQTIGLVGALSGVVAGVNVIHRRLR